MITVEVGRNSLDKVRLAMDGMLGVREARSSGIRPFRGLKEAYIFCTGDAFCENVDRGGLYLTSEAIATTDFPNILLNSLTKTCTVVDQTPKTDTPNITVASDTIYKTRAEAEGAIKTLKPCNQ